MYLKSSACCKHKATHGTKEVDHLLFGMNPQCFLSMDIRAGAGELPLAVRDVVLLLDDREDLARRYLGGLLG